MKKTVEQRIADVILQRDVATIKVEGVEYHVAPPCIATLILVSEIISTLPEVPVIPKEDKKAIFNEAIKQARHFKALGEIAAVLILGAKGLTEESITEVTEKRLFGLIRRKKRISQTIDLKAKLAKAILENITPSELFSLLLDRINKLDVGSFFAITTSLSEVNILKPTREVEK